MDPPANKARLPLTNVSNNVTLRLHKAILPTTDIPEDQRKRATNSHEETFFMHRRKQHKGTINDEDPFNLLSDEILLHVLKWLPKRTLLSCGEVNRRFCRVSRDETLWYRLDLSGRKIRMEGLIDVLRRGVVVLRLAQTTIVDPTGDRSLEFPQRIRVQYLDLSMSVVSNRMLRDLLTNCRSLLKLSLEHVQVDRSICEQIAENGKLETLNLTMCAGIDKTSMRLMVKRLTRLHSFNVGWTNVSAEAVQELVHNLTPQIGHLNVAGCRTTITDNDVEILLKRCTKLSGLDLSDCTPLTSAVIPMLCKARRLEYLSLSRCYNIDITSYLSLSQLRTLRYLDLFGLLSDTAIDTLKLSLGDVGINRYYHSSVARPTVGTKRTSIWGLRTRD